MADFFEAIALDDGARERLCRDLLSEFGVKQVKVTSRGEMIHSCCLPFGRHRNGDRKPSASLNFRKLTYKCLTGDTLVKTYDGEVPIAKLAGQTARLLDGSGKWVDAPVKYYGHDHIYRVTLSRNGVQRVVETTGDHRWYVRPKGRESKLVETTTKQLNPRQRIPSVWAMTRTGRTTLSPIGIMAGFVYGDGTRTEHGSRANFLGAKDDAMLPYFAGHEVKQYGSQKLITNGLPRSWKDLPSLDEGASYLWGWLAGYFAADGCVADDGHVTLSCASEETLRFVVALCDRLGIATYSLSTKTRTGIHGREAPLSTLSFRSSTLTSKFFLIPPHRERFEAAKGQRNYERTHWWVVSVEKTDRVEPVYCAEVSTTQSFVLAGNVLTGNCLGCGGKGGILWFIAVCRGEDGPQARKWLGEQTGMDGNVMELATLLKAIDAMFAGKTLRPPEIPEYPAAILDRWAGIHPYMTDGDPESGLQGRGVPEATLEHFRVGYAPEYFMGPERPSQERIVIPQFWRGTLVGWQARRIDDEDEPKYKNSTEFPKESTIYNFDPDDPGDVVLVESPLSVLRHWHHQPRLAATFGKDLTDWQIRLLRRCRSLTYWPDPDDAGWTAAEYAIGQLTSHVPMKIVDSPYDVDLGDMDDDGVVDELIADALPWGLWRRPERLTRWKVE